MALHPNLLITNWSPNSETDTVKGTDFTTFLMKESPQYVKGRKLQADYTDALTGNLVVTKMFSDTDSGGGMDGIDISFDWYDDQGVIGLSKTQHKPLNLAEVETIKRKRRHRAIDYLKANAAGTPVEPAVNAILDNYETAIDSWYLKGDNSLGDVVAAESDTTIIGYLDIVLDPADNPDGANIATYDVRAAILYQIDYPYSLWP